VFISIGGSSGGGAAVILPLARSVRGHIAAYSIATFRDLQQLSDHCLLRGWIAVIELEGVADSAQVVGPNKSYAPKVQYGTAVTGGDSLTQPKSFS
jgi:hypothetical protein